MFGDRRYAKFVVWKARLGVEVGCMALYCEWSRWGELKWIFSGFIMVLVHMYTLRLCARLPYLGTRIKFIIKESKRVAVLSYR
jgi:hypothetical protein